MPVSTLKRMAHRASVKYIRNIDDIGQMPVELVHAIINKIDNAAQLHRLELNSPRVSGHTKDAWLNLLKRDIPNYEARMPDNWRETIFAVENADRWYKVYAKLRRQVEKESKEVNERLLGDLRGIETKQPIKISNSLKKASNSQQRNRKGWVEAKYDSNKDLYRSGGGAGTASGKASAGASFFEKLNRNAVTKASARMRTPTHKLKPVFNKEVKRAPMGLVEDLKERQEMLEGQRRAQAENERRDRDRQSQKNGAAATPTIRVPRPNMSKDRDGRSAPPLHGPNPNSTRKTNVNPGPSYDLTQDREARLRNLKGMGAGRAQQQSQSQSQSQLSSSSALTRHPTKHEIARLTEDFLEDYDDDGDDRDGDGPSNDDLFGETTSTSRSKAKSKARASTHSPARAATTTARQAPMLSPGVGSGRVSARGSGRK